MRSAVCSYHSYSCMCCTILLVSFIQLYVLYHKCEQQSYAAMVLMPLAAIHLVQISTSSALPAGSIPGGRSVLLDTTCACMMLRVWLGSGTETHCPMSPQIMGMEGAC